MLLIALIVLLLTILLLTVNWAQRINKHWERKGIKFLKPVPFFGNCLHIVLNRKTLADVIAELYNTYPNELVLGYYEYMIPKLIVRDHELMKKVLIKDFSHFVDHVLDTFEENCPGDGELFMMTGNKWRALRLQMAPLFTSGKLKTMFDSITQIGNNLLQYLDNRLNEDIDIHEATSLFAMDIIGSTVFGIDSGVLHNPDSEFRQMEKKLTNYSLLTSIRFWIYQHFPKLGDKIGVPNHIRKVKNYYCDIIRNTINYRKENSIKRNDFVQMMIQLKEKGKIELKNWDSNDEVQSESSLNISEKFDITDEMLISQAYSFLIAGFESTSLLLTYTVMELCKNNDIQDMARKEIIAQVKSNGGLSYDVVKNLKYLEQIIKETQRFYPFNNLLIRICTKDYILPNGFTIKKGEYLHIPVSAIHKDPSIYFEPNTFKPERFEEDPQAGTFLPFGDGPRMCIALKYAMLVIKYGLALLIMNYKVKLSPKTKLPVHLITTPFKSFPTDKILFTIEKISNK